MAIDKQDVGRTTDRELERQTNEYNSVPDEEAEEAEGETETIRALFRRALTEEIANRRARLANLQSRLTELEDEMRELIRQDQLIGQAEARQEGERG